MIVSTFSGLPKYFIFPEPFIFALMESIAKTSPSPEPLIIIVADLDLIDGLVIPGGESTTMSLLINSLKLWSPLNEFAKDHPVLGTCAGLIMMARDVTDKRVKPLGLLDIVVDRNAYGRQIESSTQMVTYCFNSIHKFELATTLIRAPIISEIGVNIQILGKFDGVPVAVLSEHHLGLSFHPELNEIDIFHEVLFDTSSQYFYKKLNHANAT